MICRKLRDDIAARFATTCAQSEGSRTRVRSSSAFAPVVANRTTLSPLKRRGFAEICTVSTRLTKEENDVFSSSVLRPSVAETTVSPSGRFPRSLRSLGMTNCIGVSGGDCRPLMPSPSGARRGGAKHRKNSPRVTVFSQSGEVAILRAGRWHECERSEPSGRMRGINLIQTKRTRCHFER